VNKVYVLFQDCGIPEGLDLLAVCDSLEHAQSISAGEPWTYNATDYSWAYETTSHVVTPYGGHKLEFKARFAIYTFVMNDLEEIL
jgi:hypothetical protein